MEGEDGRHDQGVRRWEVVCRKPEAERAGCQSRVGAVYDGGEAVVILGRSNGTKCRKFQSECGEDGRCLAEGIGRAVVRLRGGGGNLESSAGRADRGVVGNGRCWGRRSGIWVAVCVVSPRGRICVGSTKCTARSSRKVDMSRGRNVGFTFRACSTRWCSCFL
jgi:hypothetical protein